MNQSGVPEQKVQLCIDQGNSSVKAGIFSGDDLLETFRFDKFTREALDTIEIKYNIGSAIISSVTSTEDELKKLFANKSINLVVLSHKTKLPFTMLVAMPNKDLV